MMSDKSINLVIALIYQGIVLQSTTQKDIAVSEGLPVTVGHHIKACSKCYAKGIEYAM